ncbi:MAG: hypothetical protein ACE5JA_02715 [bacterium]
MDVSTSLWVWIAAGLTLCIYSFLYGDNPFYRFAEYLFVGVAVGWNMAVVWYNSVIPRVWTPLVARHQYWVIFPVLLGVLVFSLFTRKQTWLVRWPIAFVMGASAGIAVPVDFQGYIFKQLQGSMLTVLSVSNAIAFVGVVSTLLYFYFSKEHKGAFGRIAGVGIWFIMVAFGASFGYTVMARISLLIGRMQFLLHDWLGIIE